jgi:ectoine hydroxylase-related dioxygenase (phytanoyl-CoA dioxygenase family)
MQLTDQQVQSYRENGYLLLPGVFSEDEVQVFRDELPGLFAQDTPARVLEKGTGVVRSVYGSHAQSEVFARLVRDPRMLGPARRLLDDDVYVHQFKINAKQAFGGEVWEWHQDYVFWRNEDGMPTARVVNVTLYLDEVNEFNGPLLLIPGSQRYGVIEPRVREKGSGNGGATGMAWASDVAADLTYSFGRDTVAGLVERHGIVSSWGPAGTLLLFHPDVVHGSAPNMSPFDRALLMATYNSVHNTPVPGPSPRPEFLCARDHTPLAAAAEQVLEPAAEQVLEPAAEQVLEPAAA